MPAYSFIENAHGDLRIHPKSQKRQGLKRYHKKIRPDSYLHLSFFSIMFLSATAEPVKRDANSHDTEGSVRGIRKRISEKSEW